MQRFTFITIFFKFYSIVIVLKDMVQFVASKTIICQKNAKMQRCLKIGLTQSEPLVL